MSCEFHPANKLDKFYPDEMEEQVIIQAFEYTFELAWKTPQDVLEEESGYDGIKGPRPVIKQAFKDGLMTNGEKWMEMLKDRNRSSHAYNEDTAQEIVDAISQNYYSLFCQLDSTLRQYL